MAVENNKPSSCVSADSTVLRPSEKTPQGKSGIARDQRAGIKP